MIAENIEISNGAATKVLRQLTLDREVDERLVAVQQRYNAEHNLKLTVQDVIRKMILDHPDF